MPPPPIAGTRSCGRRLMRLWLDMSHFSDTRPRLVILAVRQNKPHSRCGGAQGDTRLRAVPYPAYVHVASAVAVTPLPRMCAPAVATAPHVHAAPALAKAPHVHGLPPSASSHPGPSQPRLSDLASVRVCHIYIQPSEFLLSAASDLIM